jgi:peptidoglycan pentaglycine glycine transferase (the first glycine)
MQASLSDWNKFILTNPQAHIMQHGAWGELKQKFGWSVFHVISGNIGAQVLIRKMPFGFNLAYIPKGPVGENWDGLFHEIHDICLSKGVFALKIEPDIWDGEINPNLFVTQGFALSWPIQPQRSIVVDLNCSEEEILDRMKQKTRYNIRLAIKKSITVQSSENINIFHELLLKTGERDQFGIHNLAYYQMAHNLLSKSGNCQLFLAYYEQTPLAGLMVFTSGSRAWYFYGASTNEERDRMPTYLLQWEAMRWAKKIGCSEYDLWGVPDEDESILERDFMHRSDGLWGVYRFKRGFGGQIKRTIGAWDHIYSPLRYQVFQNILKIRNMQIN